MAITFEASGTVNVAATTSSGRVALTKLGTEVLVSNSGSVTAFIEFGDVTVVAVATTSTPVLAGTQQVFRKKISDTYAAAITGASTATVYFTTGVGA